MGNVIEIVNLLDDDIYTGEEVREHYRALAEKWGEWEIVGESDSGFVIKYIDIKNVLFSNLMITYTGIAIGCFVISIIFGKIVLPMLIKYYKGNNDELVDMATLRTAAKVDANINVNNKKEWF